MAITITADSTLDFNTMMGWHYGVDVEAIFNHPIVHLYKYKVTAYPHVNIREKPDANSADIGDKLYLQVVSGVKYGDWLKLDNEPGYISMAWLEEV